MINGLHSCKPENEPEVGQVKTFVIIDMPARDGKKAWKKIKSASADQLGTPFKIVTKKATGFTDSHGNISFNLEIEPAENGQQAPAVHSNIPPQLAVMSAVAGSNDNRQNRIERQHSQEMAVRTVGILVAHGLISTPEEMKTKIRDLTDYYQRDIAKQPLSKIEAQAKTMFNGRIVEEDAIDEV